ncbi:hypothetical protein PTTG_29272 [Puccinia triticina 1-1 BBBD Race 1]|uniref:Uncharacterized protein n=1 Tax=Puccinia triticina (isolate 1-1 / race 1 (BBBD)) TaxID=630390 RepID=A0A180G5D2_PUCT1|nr:hypothetical protein PTTG_29272 [Puccinia triticina 1-1 BBBD Race 1]
MLVKICWILCFVLAVVSALHPEAANAPDQPDCLHNTAKTTEPEARKQHFNPGISNGPGFNFASRKTNLEKRELLSVQMRKRIRKDLAAWRSKFSHQDEVFVRWAIDVNIPEVRSTREVKVQLPLRIVFVKTKKLVQ